MTNFKRNLNWLTMILLSLPIIGLAQAESMRGIKSINTNNKIHESTLLTYGPSNIESDTLWLHYDDVDMFDSWGFLISGEEYDIVAKWDPSDLTNYDGWEITKVRFIVTNANPYLKVKVWEGPNTTEIYSQDVDTYNVSSWTEVILDTPVPIDITQELWVGYYVDMTHIELGGFVTATDDGPAEDEYGNLYRWNGTWYSDFYNHNLQVYIEANLNSDFEADNEVICFGSTVNFNNLSVAEETYNWTFEGGTPATSTDENPSVVYNTPGVYDVTLEVTRGVETDTEIKQDYINVLDTPAQANMPEGETGVCTDLFYSYSVEEVLYAQDYEWEIDPSDVGTIVPDGNMLSLQVAEDWTGDFTISVRATNICGDGDWSDNLEVTSYMSPVVYGLQGGGGYCLDGDGVEITLDGSDDNAEYELYLDEAPTGNIVSGTGSEISFGMITVEGNYTVVGSNPNCETFMDNEVMVEILFPPLEPAAPTGPEVICEETSSDYVSTGSGDADSYVWEIAPEDAGTIEASELEATVTWNSEFTGTAMITLYGINDCGVGGSSEAIEVSVGSPNPQVAGEAMVCDWSEENYQVADNDGSTYTWEVTAGTITEGQGTYMVTVSWEGEGQGTVSVSEETAGGCEGDSELFEVTIDDCTGFGEGNTANKLTVSPNPVNGNYLTVNTGSSNPIQIKIFNTKGGIVKDLSVSGISGKINISDLPSGLYFLKANTNSEKESIIKFIKN